MSFPTRTLACRPLTEETARYIRNTFDLRQPGNESLMGKVSVAVEWVQLLANVAASSAHVDTAPTSTSEPGTDAAALQDEEAILEWHLGSLSIKVRQS